MRGEKKGYFGFEQLEVYELAMGLIEEVYRVVDQLPIHERHGLADQLRRASLSVALNIAEGKGRGSNKDFVRILYLSRGSLLETVCALQIAVRLRYIALETYEPLAEKARHLSAKLNALIRHMSI